MNSNRLNTVKTIFAVLAFVSLNAVAAGAATHYPLFADGASGNEDVRASFAILRRN
jgi:hypothetical protein